MSDPAITPAITATAANAATGANAVNAANAATPLAALTMAANMAPSLDELQKLYSESFTSTLIKFVILTIVQLIVLVYVFAGGGIAEIAKNWPKYRCNPAVMPFAYFFGVDASENFNYCMKNIFMNNAGGVLGPLYGIMANFTDTVGVISNVANSFRYLIANLLHGMERLMGSFRDRFQFILFQVRLSFLKILSLMGRLYSTFYAIVYMGLSALRTAENVANNDLVRFLLEFCFDPNTPITMADGSIKTLSMVKIGDKLAAIEGANPVVTSVFKFDGSKTPMVQVDGVIVSAKHYLYYNPLAHWIEAGLHPDAVVVPSLPVLSCLNTDTHTLRIGSTVFADYDESDSPDVISRTQVLAEQLLNGQTAARTRVKPLDYALGIDGTALVTLIDGRTVALKEVEIGDRLASKGIVMGIVKEVCPEVVVHPDTGLLIAAAQLVWSSSRWVRAVDLWPPHDGAAVLYHLITSNNRVEIGGEVCRDYREVSAPEMETAYADELSKKLNTTTSL